MTDGLDSGDKPDRSSPVSPQLPAAQQKQLAPSEPAPAPPVRLRRIQADPYAGLPADDVLDRLDTRFPDIHFPERLMQRVEIEQQHRFKQDEAKQALLRYEAETVRQDNDGDRKLQERAGKRAERELYVLVLVGLLCLFTGHEATAGVVLGTTVVGVVGAFLKHQFRKPNGGGTS